MASGDTRAVGDAARDEHQRQVEGRLHPGRGDAGADRADAALQAIEGEAGPGRLLPPVDEGERDDGADGDLDEEPGFDASAASRCDAADHEGGREAPRRAARRWRARTSGGLTRKWNTRRRRARTPARPVGEGRRDERGDDEGERRQEDERRDAGELEADGPDAGAGQERDGEDGRGRRVDDREEGADRVAVSEGAHGVWVLSWFRDGCGSGESRWPIPSRRDPPSVVHRTSRSGRALLRVRRVTDRYPGIGRDHPRGGWQAPLPVATVHTTMDTQASDRIDPTHRPRERAGPRARRAGSQPDRRRHRDRPVPRGALVARLCPVPPRTSAR